jgi:dihydropyrimidine dehydrogenase (NAD+) subunit PreA
MPLSSDIEGRCHYSGLSGPLIKPIALGICANLALSVDVPISAIGGIVDWRDTVEFLLAGASNVQVGTGMMWYGLGLGTRLRRGLESYMKQKGYSSIQDFRGHALRYLVTTEKQDSRGHTVRYISTAAIPEAYPSDCHMELSREKCNMCRMCLIACRDASMDAIEEVNGNLRIDRSKCTICGLCMVVCKPGAIALIRKV